MRSQCNECEYQKFCFWCLKFVKMYLSDTKCQQGRKKAQRSLDETAGTDHKVPKV